MPQVSRLPLIVSALKKRGPKGLTAEQLLERTGVSKSALSRHLKTLVDSEKVLVELGEKTTSGAGRPPNTYVLASTRG